MRRVALCLLAALPACRTRPEPLLLPPVEPTVEYRPFAAERGPRERRLAVVTAVASAPDGRAVAEAAAAIVRDRGAPFRGRSSLPIGSRWLDADDVAAWRAAAADPDDDAPPREPLGERALVLLPDLESVLRVPDSPLPAVRLHAAADGRGHAVTLLATAPDEGGQEALHVAAPVPAGAPFGLFVPASPPARGGYVLVLLPDGAPDDDAVTAARAAAADSDAPVADDAEEPMAWRVARRAVGERNRRPALLALLAPYRLPRAVDLLLAADEPALIAISEAAVAVDPAAPDVGWRLERAVFGALLPRIERAETTPGLRAALVRQLGAVGDDAATLELLLRVSADRDAFAAGLQEENLIALDDRSTAVRVRATTWLAGRDVDVAGYDPLADRDSRRQALRRHLRQEEAR